ncbi:MAG: hypothetical protein WCH96_12670, partial [Betaproteobacteria bacterium]
PPTLHAPPSICRGQSPFRGSRACLRQQKKAGAALATIDPGPLPYPHPLRDRAMRTINPHAA